MILADGYDFDIYNMEVPMELDTLEIGKRIKERRKELCLTQLDIKEKTGISSGLNSSRTHVRFGCFNTQIIF